MRETWPRSPSTEVVTILRSVEVDKYFLAKLVRLHAITPECGERRRRSSILLWSREDIFKAFVCKVLLDAYSAKYQNNRSINVGDLKYVIRFLPGLKFNGRYKEFTCKEEWRKVTEDAKQVGINFVGTPYEYVPSPD